MIETPYMATMILYLLGVLFILTVFMPEDPRASHKLLVMALIWPLYTVYLIAHDFFTNPEE